MSYWPRSEQLLLLMNLAMPYRTKEKNFLPFFVVVLLLQNRHSRMPSAGYMHVHLFELC